MNPWTCRPENNAGLSPQYHSATVFCGNFEQIKFFTVLGLNESEIDIFNEPN